MLKAQQGALVPYPQENHKLFSIKFFIFLFSSRFQGYV